MRNFILCLCSLKVKSNDKNINDFHFLGKMRLIILTFLFSISICSATIVNRGEEIFCSRASILDVRIKGCRREPCLIQKGRKVPYEIDFGFQKPRYAEQLEFQAFAPYWNVPGTGSFGSNLDSGYECSELLDVSQQCPAESGYRYTIRSFLYAHPDLTNLQGHKKGRVTTQWMLKPNNRNVHGHEGYSVCNFNVEFQIEE